jgi:hypothetical protein
VWYGHWRIISMHVVVFHACVVLLHNVAIGLVHTQMMSACLLFLCLVSICACCVVGNVSYQCATRSDMLAS